MKLSLINLHPSLRPRLPEWRKKIRRIARILERERGFKISALEIAFLDDVRMAEINWRHLRHAGPTDVITFPYGKEGGEILISLDAARRQGRKFRKTWPEELTLYLVHGMLHLAGFDDRKVSSQHAMRRKERWLLKQLKNPH